MLLPMLLLLAGCGNISNAWILADADFVDALPSEDRQTVEIEPEASKGYADWPLLLQGTYAVSLQVNRTIFTVLDAIDEVRSLPPSERTEDGRRWGPYAWTHGVDLSVWVDRTGAGRFDWGVDAETADETLPYIRGTHYAGDTVAAGDGQFGWTYDELGALVDDPTRGTVTVDYDNREGIDLLVDIAGATDGTADPLDARYAYRMIEGEGDFQYGTSTDLNGDGSVEDWSVRTRWIVGTGGRSDAVVTGGSLGSYVEEWTQCWDAAKVLVYQADTFGLYEAVGDESSCPYTGFAEVDRI